MVRSMWNDIQCICSNRVLIGKRRGGGGRNSDFDITNLQGKCIYNTITWVGRSRLLTLTYG